MSLQVMFLAEPFATLQALKWLLTCVGSHVTLQMGGPGKVLFTHPAGVFEDPHCLGGLAI